LKTSIGIAISTAPNLAALRTVNASTITTMKTTRPSGGREGGRLINSSSPPRWHAGRSRSGGGS
jgi:hypothetical protein